MKRVTAAITLSMASLALAQEPASDLPLPPTLPDPVQSGEALEPEVTIIESDKGSIYEYRINGQVYMVKVQPVAGPPYYLMDTDGDGQMDVRDDRPWNNSIPQWVLFRF